MKRREDFEPYYEGLDGLYEVYIKTNGLLLGVGFCILKTEMFEFKPEKRKFSLDLLERSRWQRAGGKGRLLKRRR